MSGFGFSEIKWSPINTRIFLLKNKSLGFMISYDVGPFVWFGP